MTAEKSMNQGRSLFMGGAATVLAAAAVPAFAQQNSTEMEAQATGLEDQRRQAGAADRGPCRRVGR